MTDFTVTVQVQSSEGQSLQFNISGNENYGLDKSLINGIRRVLLSSIPSYSFRTEIDKSDLVVTKNTTSLHNEFLIHRISLIPLFIEPDMKNKYLFHLSVEKDNPDTPLKTITANDFTIYPLKSNVNPEMIQTLEKSDYDLTKPLSQKKKDEILRPFKYKNKNNYCIVTELKETESGEKQSLELYGSPTISFAYENAKWQAVSKATYMFTKNDELFQSVLLEKIKQKNIPPEKQEEFSRELFISESERFYLRDKNSEPYNYTFSIDSEHYYNPKQLFIQSCSLLIKQFDIVKKEMKSLVSDKPSIFSIESTTDNVYLIRANGYDDTIGSIYQSYISKKLITEQSMFSIVGYKRVHPLETVIQFYVSFNLSHPSSLFPEVQKFQEISNLFHKASDELTQIYTKIQEEAEKQL